VWEVILSVESDISESPQLMAFYIKAFIYKIVLIQRRTGIGRLDIKPNELMKWNGS
jgi:hypothetical protein